MSGKGWPWTALDLPRAPAAAAEVRRAYARKLKTIDQAKDIPGFEALREAYEAALARMERTARKAGARAKAQEPLPPDPTPASATALADAAPQSRLRAGLQALSDQTVAAASSDQVRQLLADPGFQTPELDQMLRQGLAQYLRDQLLWNHLNEPYLRHPGVTADLLQALDARFGWLSDYSAFRKDFGGDQQLLEALVDRADLERSSQTAKLEIKNAYRDFKRFLVFGFCIAAPKIYEATKGSPPGSGSAIFGTLIAVATLFLVVTGGLTYLYQSVHKHMSRRVAVAACLWASAGIPALVLANEAFPSLPVVSWPLKIWVSVSATIVLFLLGRVLFRWLDAVMSRRVHQRKKD